MKFIKPSEISSKIMTLFEESDEFVIIVSPYVKISKWYKLLKKFDNLKRRNIPFQFIIRDDKTNQTSFQELNELGIDYSAIPDLHCKLYLNEKYAIVSSMNLLLSSEINSLELAYATETEEEYQELIDFSERYLNIDFAQKEAQVNQPEVDFDLNGYLEKNLSNRLERRARIKQGNTKTIIYARSNTYSCFIWSEKQNFLRISNNISSKEFDYLRTHPEAIPQIDGMRIEIQERGKKNYFNTIWATSETPLKSYDLVYVQKDEKLWIAERIVNFVLAIDDFKVWARQNLR